MEGVFVPKNEKRVTVWLPPDADGNGPAVTDESGEEVKDSQGRTVFHYQAPDGFENKQTTNEHGQPTADNYVKVDRGQIVRDASGSPLAIVEGGAAVVNPDGSHETVAPEDLKKFLRAHDQKEG